MKKTVIFLAAAVLIAGVSLLHAQIGNQPFPGAGGGPPRGGQMGQLQGGGFPFINQLNLTRDQRAQIKSIMDEQAAKIAEIRAATNDQINKVIKDLKEISPGYAPDSKGSRFGLIAEGLHQRFFSTNAISLDASGSLLATETMELEFYPFSAEKADYPFKLEAIAPVEMVVTEPLVFINRSGQEFSARWSNRIDSSSENWRKRNLYRVTFPSIDASGKNEISVTRSLTPAQPDKLFTLKVRVKIPAVGWEVKIFPNRFGGTLKEITPAPEETGLPQTFVYPEVKPDETGCWNWQATLEMPGNLEAYYPKVSVTARKTQVVEKKAKITELDLNDGQGFRFRLSDLPETYLDTALFRTETVYELQERLNSK